MCIHVVRSAGWYVGTIEVWNWSKKVEERCIPLSPSKSYKSRLDDPRETKTRPQKCWHGDMLPCDPIVNINNPPTLFDQFDTSKVLTYRHAYTFHPLCRNTDVIWPFFKMAGLVEKCAVIFDAILHIISLLFLVLIKQFQCIAYIYVSYVWGRHLMLFWFPCQRSHWHQHLGPACVHNSS